LLAQKKVTKEKGTLEVAVRGHPCPRTPRAGSGVCGQYVRVQAANSRASCARPFGLFLHLLAATWRGPGKSRARQSLPQKLCFTALDPGTLCEAAEVGWKRPRAPHAGRARTARLWRQGRSPAAKPQPTAANRRAAPARNRGCISLVTFFVQAKKVTRPPGRRTKPNRDERPVSAQRSNTKSEVDSSFRRNDGREPARKMDTGFAVSTKNYTTSARFSGSSCFS